MTRKEKIRSECETLAKEAARKIGASAWYDHADKVLTADERQQVRSLWDTMSGASSWMSAFFEWMKG